MTSVVSHVDNFPTCGNISFRNHGHMSLGTRQLQKQILEYLKDHGPTPHDRLFVELHQHTSSGSVHTALSELIRWKLIQTDGVIVKATEYGLLKLADPTYWTL